MTTAAVSAYSTTPANNTQANTGVVWDEGMSPAQVNNSARQNMADLRSFANDLIWFQYGSGTSPVVAPVYVSSTSFKVAGVDVSTPYHVGRRVKAVGSSTGTIYGKISAVAFSTDTTVTVVWDSGSLSNETLTISLSQAPVTGTPIPLTGIGNMGTGVAALLGGASSGTGGPVGTTGPSLSAPSLASPTISSGGISFSSQGNIQYASATEGQVALTITGSHTGNNKHFFYDFAANSANNATTCYYVGQHSSTGRSINAGGTINASGADYAEYESKAPNCGIVAKGQIVGFDTEGRVTDKWADAVSFGIKSTNPSYVGGDTWGNEDALGAAKPVPPVAPAKDADADTLAAYAEAQAEHLAASTSFETILEGARLTVDRIAYSGKVPVNVTGAAVGDYIVPAQNGDGITGIAISEPTFAQYRTAVGRVRKLLGSGRCVVAVMVH